MGGDLAELEVEVDDEDAPGSRRGVGHGDVDRDRRRPDATLRAVDTTTHPATAVDEPATDRRGRDHPARPLEPEQERLDARLELAAVERLGDDVVGAGLEEADPLLDVVGLGDAHHRDRRQARGVARARGRPRPAWCRWPVTSMITRLWLGGAGDRGGHVGDACRPRSRRRSARHRWPRRPRDRFEEQDGAGGHDVSGARGRFGRRQDTSGPVGTDGASRPSHSTSERRACPTGPSRRPC